MGLQLWYPLIGDTKNQGLQNSLQSESGIVQNASGYLGYGALTGGKITIPASVTKQILNNKSFSYACWIYIKGDTGSTDGTGAFFGTENMFGKENRKFTLFQYPTINDLHYSWQNNPEDGKDVVYNVAGNTLTITGNASINETTLVLSDDSYVDGTTLRLDQKGNPFLTGTINGILPSKTWKHLAVTYNNPTMKVYINGSLIHTATGVSSSLSFEESLPVIVGSSARVLQDVRIYDEELSIKQIKSLFQRQLIHYPLNNIYEVGIKNKYSGDIASGYLSISDIFVRTKLSNERGYNYKLSYTGTGSNKWFTLWGNNFSFTVGKTYYYSCKVRCNSVKNTKLYLRAARTNNDWVTNTINILAKADGKWYEYTTSQVINSTFDRSGTTVTCNPLIEFCSDNCSAEGTEYLIDVDIKDIQVTEGSKYPFIANELVETTISDISGYKNNANIGVGVQYSISGTTLQISDDLASVSDGVLSIRNASVSDTTLALNSTNSSISYVNKSPRYDACYYFSEKAYIKFKNPLYKNNSIYSLTINMWIKLDSGCGLYSTILSGYNSPTSKFPWLCVNAEKCGLWSYISNNSPQYCKTGSFLTVGTWYMITYVFSTGKAYWYLNGVKTDVVTYTTQNYIQTLDNEYLALGNSYTGSAYNTLFKGWISDFRIFSYNLSDSEVLSLYQNAASLTSSGQLMVSGEVIEQ